MSIALPHFTQEKRNTCALACLRMVLAAYGTHVEEHELESQARMVQQGTPVDELERLARQFGLVAHLQEIAVDGLARILAAGQLPICFIDRAVFDLTPAARRRHSIRNAIIHNVIPVKFTRSLVTLHDPRFPHITRRSLRLFRQAYEGLGGRSVVCGIRETASGCDESPRHDAGQTRREKRGRGS
jgi:hypothetical protein